MAKPRLLLIGAGGHAHSCIDVIESEGRFDIIGLVGTEEEVGTNSLGYDVLATDAQLDQLATECEFALVAVGQIRSAELRKRLALRVSACGLHFPTIVSPYARVSPYAKLGHGTVVFHGAVVAAGAIVGTNCILNTRSVVEHGVSMGDFVHVSTGAIVNGCTTVGNCTFIGSGAVIREGLTLGANCIVGMGSNLRGNLETDTTYVGSKRCQ